MDRIKPRVAFLLVAGVFGCRGGVATVSMTEIPLAYKVSGVSSGGARLESRFRLHSEDMRSPRVRKVTADVTISGALLGKFELVEEFQLTAKSTSSALMRGRLEFGRLTPELYRSLFGQEVSYGLSGETGLTYRGLRQTLLLQGAGRLPPPRRVSITFTDETATELVRLDSARFDAAPSDDFPVGVSVSVTVTNPLSFPVHVSSANYELKIQNNAFLSGHTVRQLVLQPGPTRLHFTTSVRPVRGLAEVARRFATGRDLGVSASGQVTLEEAGSQIILELNRQ